MRIEYICHACLFIDTGDLKIVTDPWVEGPAYCGQWNVFPKPVNAKPLQEAQVLLLSHGHEDHFHPPTLRTLPKSMAVFYPYTWYGGIKPFLNDLGFANVEEAPANKTIQLSPKTTVTYIVNNLDSIMVIDGDGKVFVNINDALHSYPPRVVDVFLQYIRDRWPRIDTVFCGFGGASYFPNTVHCPGKNDREIAEAREQLFVHAFCRIVNELRPSVAVPFASDFALLRPHQRWINNARFPRAGIPDYYRELFGECPDSPQVYVMYPGDVLKDNQLQPESPYRKRLQYKSTAELFQEQYCKEIEAQLPQQYMSEGDEAALHAELINNIKSRSALFEPAILNQIEFSLRLFDIMENPIFNISMKAPEPVVQRSASRNPAAILEIEISSDLLRHSLASDWGGDAITIGYGCEIQVFDSKTVEANLDTVCVQLLTRIPTASRHWKREPIRMARYVLSSQINRGWLVNAALNRLRAKPSGNDHDEKMRQWLFRTKCEVCRACDLPILDENFATKLQSRL
jgi:hypothetical protein